MDEQETPRGWQTDTRRVEWTPARVVGPARDEEPDWYELSIPRETHQALGYLASFWRVSRENVLLLLLRAVQYGEWPAGDIQTDPAAYQAWALRVQRQANTLIIPGIDQPPDPTIVFDAADWWAHVAEDRAPGLAPGVAAEDTEEERDGGA